MSHKIISGIVLIIIVVGIYFLVKKNTNTETHYVTEVAKVGNIETTVTGTGQVEASNTITLKAKTTGDITSVNVTIGQEVRRGQLIASVDSRDAKIALENAKIALSKLTSSDSVTVVQKQNSFAQSYNDGFDTVSSYVTNTPALINEIDAIYLNNGGFLGNSNIVNVDSAIRMRVVSAQDDLYKAEKSFDTVVKTFKNLSRSSSNEEIKGLVKDAYGSARLLSLAVKNTEGSFNSLVDSINNQTDSNIISNRTSISSWVSTTNSDMNNLLLASNSINENNLSLLDTSDIRGAELTVESKQEAYNDCFVVAPFDGVVATLTAKTGESSGSSIGTLITKQKVVTVPFNEVDIASINLGQKARLSFDALPDVSINGVVSEIDSVGTVSSGVVTYNVKVSLDKDNKSIKPGMSASVEIITNYKENVLKVSNASVKTKNGTSYVEMFQTPLTGSGNSTGAISLVAPDKKEVIVGISDDTSTEIVFGLNEGDQIVSKTIAGTATTKTTAAPSILSSMGAGAKTASGGGAKGIPHAD